MDERKQFQKLLKEIEDKVNDSCRGLFYQALAEELEQDNESSLKLIIKMIKFRDYLIEKIMDDNIELKLEIENLKQKINLGAEK